MTVTDLVVLLPSLGRAASDFDELARTLADAGYTPLPIDNPPVDGTLHDIAGAIAKQLDGRRAHVLGHALGNRIARCLAADNPGLVESLILLGCGGKIPPTPEVAKALGQCFNPDLTEAEHLDAVRTAFFAPRNDPAVWTGGWNGELALQQRRAVEATPLTDWWLPPAGIPVLAVVGEQDVTAVPGNARTLVAEVGRDAFLVEIPNAGHALLPEQPDRLARAVLSFLARVSAETKPKQE